MNRLILIIACLLFSAGCHDHIPRERILFDFETDTELDQLRWKCHTLFSLSDNYVAHGTKSLKMELYPSDYPGVSPILSMNDWHKYSTLCFDIYNPGDEDTWITVRIDDQKDIPGYSERYNKRYVLKKGLNKMVIPLQELQTSGTKKLLDLNKIYRFMFFMVKPEKKSVLYLDYVRLVL